MLIGALEFTGVHDSDSYLYALDVRWRIALDLWVGGRVPVEDPLPIHFIKAIHLLDVFQNIIFFGSIGFIIKVVARQKCQK